MTMTCRDAESLLHDALDAPLPPADAAALAAHLESCAACRDLDADLALMRDAASALARPVVPAHAWTRLSAQLEQEGLIAPLPARGSASAASTPAPASWQGYAWMALAASLLAGVGASLLWRASDRVAPALPTAAVPSRVTPGNARDPRAVEAIEIELRVAAEHYEKAITALEGLAAEDRARIDPTVAQVVERNLMLIDTAIADSRKALQGQPGSLVAQASLFDAYRQKVALLQDLIAMASEAKRTGDNGAGRDRRRS
jgi:anti-sigma factor RsiW